MYAGCYHSTPLPPRLTPDYQFLLDSEEHKRAIPVLIYGLVQAEGFIVINDMRPARERRCWSRDEVQIQIICWVWALARDLDEASCIRGSMVNDVAEEFARDLVAGRQSPQNSLCSIVLSGQWFNQNIAALEHIVNRYDSIVNRTLAIAVELFGVRK